MSILQLLIGSVILSGGLVWLLYTVADYRAATKPPRRRS